MSTRLSIDPLLMNLLIIIRVLTVSFRFRLLGLGGRTVLAAHKFRIRPTLTIGTGPM